MSLDVSNVSDTLAEVHRGGGGEWGEEEEVITHRHGTFAVLMTRFPATGNRVRAKKCYLTKAQPKMQLVPLDFGLSNFSNPSNSLYNILRIENVYSEIIE